MWSAELSDEAKAILSALVGLWSYCTTDGEAVVFGLAALARETWDREDAPACNRALRALRELALAPVVITDAASGRLRLVTTFGALEVLGEKIELPRDRLVTATVKWTWSAPIRERLDGVTNTHFDPTIDG